MPVLPDTAHMDLIDRACLKLAEEGAVLDAVTVAQQLMSIPGLPMHCPYHHYLVPAALLTAAHLHAGSDVQKLSAQLKTARERASGIPGGICGYQGVCGAAIGAGIFASVWMKTTPMSNKGWAVCQKLTARSLEAIAEVEGPRCCKRVVFLSLQAALPAIRELTDADAGDAPEIRCSFWEGNRECRRKSCPFWPGNGEADK